MKPVFSTCTPREEVLTGELRQDIFAAKLEDVVEGDASPVYQYPKLFVANTYATEGLRCLLTEVMGRVNDESSSNAPIVRLETSFGGGKTHGLIALYHAARNAEALSECPGFMDKSLICARPIPFAAVVGTTLDPVNGIRHGDIKTYTIWGGIAYQVGGPEGYEIMAKSDEERTRPGAQVWEELLGDKPAIICIDEIANYQRTIARRHAIADQTAPFLHTLFTAAASRPTTAVVWTLASQGDAFAQDSGRLVTQLRELGRIGAREEIVLTPTGDAEYAPVVNHRLFTEIDAKAAEEAGAEYVRFYKREAERGVALPQRCIQTSYRDEIVRSYPFHPEMIDILSLKTSAIPNFQKTRGILRLLAQVIRNLWAEKDPDAYLIHPHHIDLSVDEIRAELTSRLDRAEYIEPIQADIYRDNEQAHAQQIDADWHDRGKTPFAQRLAQTVFLHSLTIGQARGADRAELNLACGIPGTDFDYIEQSLDRIYEKFWYIDPDVSKYRFQTVPQINKIIEDEIDNVTTYEAKQELNSRIRSIYSARHFAGVIFPEEPSEVDDDTGKPKLIVVDYDSESVETADQPAPSLVTEIYERTGTQRKFRQYQNNVVFLVADKNQIEPMIDVAKRHVALESLNSPTRLAEFEEPQQQILQGRRADAELDLRVAVTRTYRHLFYPSEIAGSNGMAHHVMDIQDSAQAERDQEKVIVDVLHDLNKVLLAAGHD